MCAYVGLKKKKWFFLFLYWKGLITLSLKWHTKKALMKKTIPAKILGGDIVCYVRPALLQTDVESLMVIHLKNSFQYGASTPETHNLEFHKLP